MWTPGTPFLSMTCLFSLSRGKPWQEVDADMVSMLNARLGVGGRYRAFPPSVPVERRYFTLVFVRVGTVKVEDSGRKVRGETVTRRVVLAFAFLYTSAIALLFLYTVDTHVLQVSWCVGRTRASAMVLCAATVVTAWCCFTTCFTLRGADDDCPCIRDKFWDKS